MSLRLSDVIGVYEVCFTLKYLILIKPIESANEIKINKFITFLHYQHFLRQYSFVQKIQSQNVNREKLRFYKKVKHKMSMKLTTALRC